MAVEERGSVRFGIVRTLTTLSGRKISGLPYMRIVYRHPSPIRSISQQLITPLSRHGQLTAADLGPEGPIDALAEVHIPV